MKTTLFLILLLLIPLMIPAHQTLDHQNGKAIIIAIPANEKGIDAVISEHFSRSSFFCFYNTKTDSYIFLENRLSDASEGGSRQVVQFLKNNGASQIYLVNAGENAQRHLKASGIRTESVPAGQTIRQIIDKRIKDQIRN